MRYKIQLCLLVLVRIIVTMMTYLVNKMSTALIQEQPLSKNNNCFLRISIQKMLHYFLHFLTIIQMKNNYYKINCLFLEEKKLLNFKIKQ